MGHWGKSSSQVVVFVIVEEESDVLLASFQRTLP